MEPVLLLARAAESLELDGSQALVWSPDEVAGPVSRPARLGQACFQAGPRLLAGEWELV